MPHMSDMATRTTHRMVNALAVVIGVACALAMAPYVTLMMVPSVAFAHRAGDQRIMFHSAQTLSRDAAERAAAAAWAALQGTPFGPPDHQINVYITNGGWRHQLFFRPSLRAGGLTYPVLSQSDVFLRAVDLEAGRLLRAHGPVADPRDLTYYLVHEITHLRHVETVGRFAFLRTPRWIMEGLPDLAALGPAGADLMARAMAAEPLGHEEFGSYPLERACVTMVLARPGMEISDLLILRAPMHVPETCSTLPRPNSD